MRNSQANSSSRVNPATLLQPPDVVPIGPSVLAEAASRGIDPTMFAAQMLSSWELVGVKEKDSVVRVPFAPGHRVACDNGNDLGPRQSDVMVIGKMPWRDELESGQLFSGAAGQLWKGLLSKHGVDFSNWYMTNICKFMPPFGEKSLKASWIKECRWFLEQEIHLVKPKYLLLMGADAVKAVMGTEMKVSTLSALRGSTNLTYKGIKVWAILHPSAACSEPTLVPQLESDLLKFAKLTRGEPINIEQKKDYRYIEDEDSLKALVDFFIASDINTFAIDCEWGGTEGADYLTGKLRTIQFSHAAGYGYCVILRRCGLVDAFKPSIHSAIEQLRRLFCRKKVRIGGHNIREDLKWLIDVGLDLTYQAYRGFDTMLMHHLLFPNDSQGLEILAMKFSDLGRYDFAVHSWLKEHGYKERQYDLYGYAFVPDELLHPYACADVDVVMRALPVLERMLSKTPISRGAYDLHGVRIETLYDLYREVVHAAILPILDIEMTGITADRERLIKLISLFLHRRDELVGLFRDMIHWPEFNFRSVDQCREFLFGDQPGKERSRPPGATCLHLTPIKTTGKPSMDWDRIPPERRRFYNPSTDSESLQILAAEREESRNLQELRFVDQVIKNFLRPAEYDAETGTVDYTKGLVSVVHKDGRVRTTLSQLTDTGRYRSCVHRDTPIVTRRGVIPAYQVVVGDLVWTHQRRWRRVLVTYVHPEQEMCNVRFSNGEVLTCTYYHKVLTCKQEWKEVQHAQREQIADARQGSGCQSSQRVSDYVEAGRGDCQRARGQSSDSQGDDQNANTRCAVQTVEEASVPEVSIRDKESQLREVPTGRGSEAVLGRLRVFDEVGGTQTILCPSHSDGGGPGNLSGGLTVMGENSPYRRGPAEQRARQSDSCNECRSRSYPREIPIESKGLDIEEVNPAGVHAVYDFCVEEDHSYSACGVFSHNSSPNMQNLPKSQEAELRKLFSPDVELLESIKGWAGKTEDFLKEKKVLHPDYYSIRSCFMASPGHVLIEADYKQAEMFVLAYLSGDTALRDVLEDPTRDLHSENAIAAFHLNCAAADVKKLYPSHRVMAKAVGFGISYGRGANALVREIKKEGVEVTADQAQQMIDAFYNKYPRVYDYVQACHKAVINPGYVETAFGRRRWFPRTTDEAIRAAQERQATNMPIQGTVADALSVALMNVWRYRRFIDPSLPFRPLLPVHDAILVEAPYTHIEPTIEMLNLCMRQGAKVPHIGLTFYVDIEISKRWNEHISKEEAIQLASQERLVA